MLRVDRGWEGKQKNGGTVAPCRIGPGSAKVHICLGYKMLTKSNRREKTQRYSSQIRAGYASVLLKEDVVGPREDEPNLLFQSCFGELGLSRVLAQDQCSMDKPHSYNSDDWDLV